MTREPGFYWVRVRDGSTDPALVGEWTGEWWWLPGYIGEQADEQVTVLSERLTPPEG